MRNLFILLLSLAAYSPIHAQTYYGDQSEIDKILSRSAAWSEHYVEGDIRALADLYTEDGMILPNGALIISGKDAIAERFQLKEGYTAVYHKATPEEISIHEDTAYDIGYYEGTTQNEAGESSSFYGKYIIIWHKRDGVWSIYADIWNSAPERK